MSAATDTPSSRDGAWSKELATTRDTVQSIGIAVVLAFVLRAFLIEAFVIPTGSMAPRLMGEHWRLKCPVCAYEYDHGWPERRSPNRGRRELPTNASCPNCHHEYDASAGAATWVDGGDRVLVLKYLNNFRDPQPWDVVVFRNPQNNRENYIKRLVGLPGETIEIIHGDVWVKTNDDAPWAVRRKPPAVQEVMWQIIHDNDYQPLVSAGQPTSPAGSRRSVSPDIIPRWVDPHGTGLWDQAGDYGRRFVFAGGASGGLRFDVPSGGGNRQIFLARYGYNKPGAEQDPRANAFFDSEICTDLKLSFVYTPRAEDSRVALLLDALAEGYAAEVAADGTVRLLHREAPGESILARSDPAELTEATGWTTWQQTKITPLAPGRGHKLALTNADYRLTLWVDGRAVLASTDTQYPADYKAIRRFMADVFAGRTAIPTPQVAIAAAGGPCELLHLKLQRDVYYTYTRLQVPAGPQWAYARSLPPDIRPHNGDAGWGMMGRAIRLRGDQSAPNNLDSFYVLGDNSPQSHDSRRWTQAGPTLRLWKDGKPVYQLGAVPRYNMIGKAVFVYWPSGFRLPGPGRLPWIGLPGPASLPLIPNVGSMRRVQ